MERSLKILTWLYKSKSNSKGEAPIFIRLTLDGKKTEISTGKFIPLKIWDSSNGMVLGKDKIAKQINEEIQNIKSKIQRIHSQFEMAEQAYTLDTIKNKLLGKSDSQQKSLMQIFAHHNKQYSQRVGKEHSAGTMRHYQVAERKLHAFLKSEYKRTDILLSELDHRFVANFDFYLKTKDNCQNNTAIGHIKKLKKVVSECVANGWIERNPFANFKCKSTEGTREYLIDEEINLLASKDLSRIPRLEVVRDLFLFGVYTGLSYSDIEKLTPNDITYGVDGERWICTPRVKTKRESQIMLLPQAMMVIEKYKECIESKAKGKLLPVKSNQKLNAYLKELADICGITKNLSCHIARHTFATTITLNNGVPMETVSKMLGHSSIRTTQIYSKITKLKISNDMKMLKEKLSTTQSDEKSDNIKIAI